jgi:nitric oxide reductase subunit B
METEVTPVPDDLRLRLESFQNGFWSARSWDFHQQPLIRTLLWLRMVPDSIFTAILAGYRAETPCP